MGPWGKAAAGVLGVGVGVYLYMKRADQREGESKEGSPFIVEAKPPSDAKDPNGAKAPGKPGPDVGFKDLKGGEQWVKEPNGPRFGWLHKDGSV